MNRHFIRIFFFIGALISASRALGLQGTYMFPTHNKGWLGGDAVYSIRLAQDKILWLFGDTFSDPKKENIRRWQGMVGNSVGVSTRTETGWSTEYFFGASKDKTLPFFNGRDSHLRYWARHGFVNHGIVHVFLTEVKHTGTGPYGFEVAGSSLASFREWRLGTGRVPIKYRHLDIPSQLMVGSAVSQAGDEILIFSTNDLFGKEKRRPVYLNKYERRQFFYYTGEKDRPWKLGLYGPGIKEIVDNGANEMSVHFHKASNQWVMVYSDVDVKSGRILYRTSSTAKGPWSPAKTLYVIDEVVGPQRVPFSFSYAAKAHPALEIDDRLAVTYIVNLDEDASNKEQYERLNEWRILKPEFRNFYIPQLVYIKLP